MSHHKNHRVSEKFIFFVIAVAVFFSVPTAHAQTCWLNSAYDEAGEHYPTAEEACLVGELQRRLDIHQSTSTQQHRYNNIYLGTENGIGERICQGVIQRRQFNLWLPVEQVFALVYGPLGSAPLCPLDGTADSDTGESYHTGRLAHIQDASGTTSYCYNRYGDITRKEQNTEGTTLSLRYQYHANGQLQHIQYPDGTIVDCVYDSLGRISEIGSTTVPQARQIVVTNIQYAPFGEPTQWQYGNGRILARTFDQNYRTTHIHDNAADGLNIQYFYDAIGNITKIQASQNAEELQYDGLNRILGQHGAGIHREYSWDKTGNRTSFTDTNGTHNYDYFSNNHWLKAVDNTPRDYDHAGNSKDTTLPAG